MQKNKRNKEATTENFNERRKIRRKEFLRLTEFETCNYFSDHTTFSSANYPRFIGEKGSNNVSFTLAPVVVA